MNGPLFALNVLFIVLFDAAYALTVGCVLAETWLDGAAQLNVQTLLRRTALACVGAMIVSQLVRPWFAAASMSGSNGFRENLAMAPDVLTGTHQGKLWWIGSLALAILFSAMFFGAHRTIGARSALFAIPLLLIAAIKAASGHAANDGDFTLAEFALGLHVLSIAVWAGSVMVSGVLVLPRLAAAKNTAACWNYGQHLSKTVTWALVVIVLSGVYATWHDLNGNWSGLWLTGWGKVLIAKLIFVAGALALGALARFRCIQPPPSDHSIALMLRLIRAEAVVMALILCLSGTLANLSPVIGDASSLLQIQSGSNSRCNRQDAGAERTWSQAPS